MRGVIEVLGSGVMGVPQLGVEDVPAVSIRLDALVGRHGLGLGAGRGNIYDDQVFAVPVKVQTVGGGLGGDGDPFGDGATKLRRRGVVSVTAIFFGYELRFAKLGRETRLVVTSTIAS
ncbi:hypothetical protein Amsp01_090260 [Amycolatopsis sp. NBRC 101858]|nr:hypothetical protein Amsp01_090260 [Amycolatopsis sp. NBRC 101858]